MVDVQAELGLSESLNIADELLGRLASLGDEVATTRTARTSGRDAISRSKSSIRLRGGSNWEGGCEPCMEGPSDIRTTA
jgi:hypothetical protein